MSTCCSVLWVQRLCIIRGNDWASEGALCQQRKMSNILFHKQSKHLDRTLGEGENGLGGQLLINTGFAQCEAYIATVGTE